MNDAASAREAHFKPAFPASSASSRAWLVMPPPATRRMRLYCFPYAGGNAVAYLPWQTALDPEIEICAVQLPGRGARIGEAPCTSLPELVAAISGVLARECREDGRPFAFFGHSLGALLAFETVRFCSMNGLPLPQRLIVSGCNAPQHRGPPNGLHLLPDDELIAALATYNGTPPEVLADRKLMSLLLPGLRADFALAANYVYAMGRPLTVPVTVLAARQDSHIAPDKVAAWRMETVAPCRLQWFEGDHFFINSQQDAVLGLVMNELAREPVRTAPRHFTSTDAAVKTVFLFSGQGSHYFQMGRDLFECNDCFRATLQRLDRVAGERCGQSVLTTLYDESRTRQQPFNRTLISHPAIFMVEYALACALIEAGAQPDFVLGSSLGSFAAAAVADCIDADAALCAVIEQATTLEAHCEPGCMIAVMAEPARYMTSELSQLCELAAVNFATHSVISLPQRHVAQVEAALRAKVLAFQRLEVSFAFHSRWIDAAKQPYQEFLRSLEIRQAAIPVVCCASADIRHRLPADYFWSVARDPIRFQQTIESLETSGSYRYIDVGPGGTLATFLKHGSRAGPSTIQAVMSPFGRDAESFAAVLAPQRASVRATTKFESAKQTNPENRNMRAIIFPGQGAQFKGMGKEVFPIYPELLASASDILGYSIEDLCLNDPRGSLSQTRYTQPALYVVNALHYKRQQASNGVKPAAPKPDFLAGHSLGEYNALLAAGVFSFETGLQLVKKRGELMGAATGGAMAAAVGISAQQVQAVLDECGLAQIDIANYNSPTQTVIAGEKDALAAAVRAFSQRGMRCVVLNVSAAFHSRHMQAAQLEFAAFLQQFSFSEPHTTVIANATARPYEGPRIAETLVRQIASPVQWVDSIRYLMGRGEVEFEEIGAKVLTKMVLEIRSQAAPKTETSPVARAPTPAEHTVETSTTDNNEITRQVRATSLGSAVFKDRYRLQYAYVAGAMYRGVASAELVVKMGKSGFLSFFGAGGLSLAKIEANIVRIQSELNAGQPYGMNLLANYEYPAQESAVVDLYLKYRIRNVEAAAFMQMTPALVRFRLSGLRTDVRGEIVCDSRVVAKISRPEVARAFMSPPPLGIVEKLLEQRLITPLQAELSQKIPVSHDICVEADSGGHTDGGIAAVMLPPLLRLRDEMQRTHGYAEPLCMGLAGGIGGPEAAAAAFLLGADFVMTGSINQCTVEAGMSADGKSMLQDIDIQHTDYAPAGDMFEIGAQVQVLKKSVFFPSRANKLHSLYRQYGSLEEIPERTRRLIEGTFFKKTFEEVWTETQEYFRSRELQHEIIKAEANPKHKMALVFRWYFAYSTRIALEGKGEDRVNYQIQTGPALGSFNQWVKGTELEQWTNRHVDGIAVKLMQETAAHLERACTRFLSN